VRIDVRPLRGPPLVEDYLAGRDPAASFYAGHPGSLDGFRAKLEETGRRFGPAERRAAAAALRPTSRGAAERLRRFVAEGGAFVTTGQQAGLFTGPLYTIHKIVTAIRLADALEAALGTVVLPVFWVASEDHDFAEARETFFVGEGGELVRLAASRTDPRDVPMSDMQLDPHISDLSDSLRYAIAVEDYTHDHLTRFLSSYQAGETVAVAFRDTVERLFAGFDLLVTDAADPALKASSMPVLQRAIAEAAAQEAALEDRTRALEGAGYGGQVALVRGAANVFYHGPGGRERLVRGADGWRAPGNRRRFTERELVEAIARDPGRFSPNVLLRPVVESAVFPTLAYVGGPAEIAYFAQAAPLFDAAGIRPPVAFPRFSATLVPPEVDEARPAVPLEDGELALPEHEAWALVGRRTLPGEVRARMEAVRRALVGGFGPLIEAAEAIDPNLRPVLGSRRDRAMLEIAEAERKVLSHHRKRSPERLAALRLVRNHLAPLGQPQERVLNVFPFLARDPRLLERLAAAMEVRFPAPAGAPDP
jgi:bacillithiol synthase